MKSAIMALASLALAAGMAAAQNGKPTQTERKGTRTEYGTSRLDKRGSDQTYNTGNQGQGVGKDRQQTYTSGQQAQAIPQRSRRAAGTGVATGFVAAGVGLALLGLFVRRRTRRHPDDPDYHEHDDEHDSGF